jgi:hypothetical protein
MKSKITISLLAALAPVISQAHPGHSDSHLLTALPSEYIELLMTAFAVTLLFSTHGVAGLRRMLTQIRNRLVNRR